MNIEGYDLEPTDDDTTFNFSNDGPSGSFPMGVQFTQPKRIAPFWNLAFGVWKEVEKDGIIEKELDDFAVTDNGNRDEILGTVINSLFKFWDRYPDRLVIFEGSTYARTRLYKGIINRYKDDLSNRIDFFGYDPSIKQFVPYVPPGIKYSALVVGLK